MHRLRWFQIGLQNLWELICFWFTLTHRMQPTQNLWLLLLVSCTLNLSSFSLLQSLSCARLFATQRTAAHKASLTIINYWSLLKLMSIELVISSNHLILCCPLSSWLQFFLASGSFLMSQFLASGGQSIGVSASASVLPMNVQNLFPLRLTGLMPWQTKRLSRVFPKFKSINSLVLILLYSPNLMSIHDYWKNHSFE